ncbi:hypothetical protein GCM10011412_09920 [Maribacter cobaltidurans]|nr:hypothetical protein GCM10011412_09920 [Maribacter cobaltidurans]
MFLGPGLTGTEPIGGFLNGNFPDVDLSDEPYEEAYGNVRFDWPLTFTPVPGQSRIVIGQLDGKIYWMDDVANPTKNLLVDFSAEVGDAIPVNGVKEVWDGGLLGLELHPNFGTAGNNYVYIYYTTDSGNPAAGVGGGASGTFGCFNDEFHGNYLNLERFELNPTTMAFVANSRVTLMKRRMLNSTHRGGAMEFGNDGYLYVATGEQGRAVSAQDITDNLDGGVLRIDVDMNPSTGHAPIRTMPQDTGETDEITGQFYFIPDDNPFQSPTGATFEEYYTLGIRSPHRMSKDSQTGELYIGDVGESTHDEINVVSAGKNYGWPIWEGNDPPPNYDCGISMLDNMPHEGPLTEFDRTDAVSIIGGHVYRGTEFTAFNGKFITADWGTRKIFSVDIVSGDYETLGTLPGRPISFGENANGDIFYLTQGNNVPLYRFVEPGVTSGMPQTLTATGAFTDLQNLIVADGFVPYEMIDPFWSDGAYKKRWLAVPNPMGTPQPIQYSEDGTWVFPVGSVLIKHFDYPIVDANGISTTKKIETRFSIKNSNGNWTFLSYNWNQAETEAFLVDMSTGLSEALTINETTNEEITWRYPSTNECLNCHNPASQGTLGPRTRYLNSDYDYSQHDPNGVSANQLVTLSHLGILDQTITDADTDNFLTHTSINDPNAGLEEKARSYMDLNCAYCHQPANDLRPQFDLRLMNSLAETGLLTSNVTEIVSAMPSDQRIVYAGDASKSQIYHRTNSTTPGVMMPPLAKGQVDEEGVALLEAWINQLNAPPTAVATSDSTIGNAPLSIQFTGSNSTDDQGVVSYAWDFGDGGTSTAADPSYIYTTPGQYTATLTVTDGDGQIGSVSIDMIITGGTVDNTANASINLALLSDAIVQGSVEGGRGVPKDILFDPTTNDYFQATPFNEYGVAYQENLGTVGIQDAFTWRVDWISSKMVNYITFGGVFPNQPQPNTLWRISYRSGNTWTILEEGQGGWLDSGIYEWGGSTETPIQIDGLRVQIYSDGTNDLVSIHLRGRGGVSNSTDDSNTEPKATLIQYLPDKGAPTSDFTYTANDLEVTFDSSGSSDSDGTIDSYNWDFGDGNTSTVSNPIHNYAAPGTYTVILTVTDNDGLTDDRSQDITVDGIPAIPVAVVSSDVSSGSAPFNVQFNGSNSTDDVGITSYAWDFGDGGSSTEADPAYIYNLPGQYIATLTVTDVDGNSDSTSVIIIASGGNADNTPNAGINLALLPDAYVNGNAMDGRGAPEDILYDPSIDNYFQPTDFNEYGVARNANLGTPPVGEGFNWQVDWITPKLVNYITFGGVFPNQPQPNSLWRISYRVGNDWTILEEGQGGWLNSGIYEWGSSTETPIEIDGLRVQMYSDGTNDLVSIHLRGRGGISNRLDDSITEPKATLIQYLPDTGAPESAFSYVVDNLNVSFDSSNSSDNLGIESFTWDFGDGNGSTMANPSHTYAEAGVYTVSLTVTDIDGLSDTTSQQVTVTVDNSLPVALASSNVNVGLAPLSIQFTGSNSTDDIGVVSYAWDFGDGGTATGADPNYSYTVPGTYNAILTVTDGDGNWASETLTIVVSSGVVNNTPNPGLNLALVPDALVGGNVENGRGTPQHILYDPSKDDYFIKTDFNEYGVLRNESLGTPGIDDGFRWQVDWVDRKQVNYITFGGVYPNQPQSNSLWRISYRVGNSWVTLEEGQGGWLNSGIYEWGGPTQVPIEIDGLRVQVYSDGINELVSIHLRGRGGVSNVVNDSGTQPKATLIQYLPETGAPESVFDYTINDLDVTFDSSNSSDDIGIVSYAWDFGDGSTSTDVNPVHTYATSGTYTVYLMVTDGDGISDTSSADIFVGNPANEAPIAVIGTSLITGAAPLSENFTGSNSTDDVGIVSYVWDFGDGSTSTEPDPTHVYLSPGTYLATLTVTDGEGLTDQASVTIIATSDVATNAPNAGINLGLAQDAILSGSVTNGGRGTPQAILYDPGRDDYFVKTAYNEYGVAVNQNLGTPGPEDGFQWQVDWASRKYVNYITFGGVYPNQPQPNSLWRISYRVGNTWTILDEGQGSWIDAGIYEWGGIAQTPIEIDGLRVQVYSDGTNDLVSIHLRGRGGISNSIDDSATQTKATLIQYLPDAGAPESAFDYTVTELEVTFDSAGSSDDMGIAGYLWDFGDGNTSTEANPIYEYFQSGTYDVSLTVTDADGKEDTVTQSITVNGNGRPTAIADSDVDEGSAPLLVQFTGSGSTDDVGIASYAWDFGDGGASTVADPIYEYTNDGVYMVTLTVSDAEGRTDETSLTITVTQGNDAPVAFASSNVSGGAAPLSVQFMGSNSTDDNGIASYSWDFGDGGTSTQADPIYEYLIEGVYTATLTVTDAEGLTDEASLTITVTQGNEAPVAVISSDVSTGTAPLTVQFTGSDSTDDVGIESYEWDFGDGNGTSTDINPTYTFDSEGTYEVTLIVTDAAGALDSATLTITVTVDNAAPIAVAAADVLSGPAPFTVQFSSSGTTDDTGIASFAWDFGDGGTSTEPNPSYEFTTEGTYTVVLVATDDNGAVGTAELEIVVEANETLEEEELEMIVSPNPSSDFVEVTLNGAVAPEDIVGFMLHDSAGRLIRQYQPAALLQGAGVYRIDLDILPNEIYVVTLVLNNQDPISKRIILRRQ